MNARLIYTVVLSLLTCSLASLAQQTTTSPTSNTINRPGSIQAEGSLGYWANMEGQGRAGGYLLGKVSVPGTPFLWDPVLVVVVCDGKTVYATNTDSVGAFGITATNIAGSLSLQDDAKREMETHLEGCRVRSSLPGFSSNVLVISHRNLREDPDIGVLTLERDESSPGTAVSKTTGDAPPKALKAYIKAHSDVADHDIDGAQKELNKAVGEDPQFAEAWFQLGKLQQGPQPDAARKSYAAALAADPTYLLPYLQLSAMAVHDKNWSEVVLNTSHSLMLDPSGYPGLWYYDALAKFELGNTDAAEESAQKSMAMDPQHSIPNAEQLLAAILARKRDYASAIDHLRNCIKYSSNPSNTEALQRSIARLEQLRATGPAAAPLSEK